jgi:hypothetical protein
MGTIIYECEVSEYEIISNLKYDKNVFYLNKDAIVISFCDTDDTVIDQSEMTIDDAIRLAKLILHYYER